MLTEILADYKIILGSGSPRRKQLLKELNLDFEVRIAVNMDESFPKEMHVEAVPLFLAKQKASALQETLKPNELLITADTVVILDNTIINKPVDEEDAFIMLKSLSGKVHRVNTGVCITTIKKQESFDANTDVYFKELSNEEIKFYISKYKPFDKAGAYGIQEWIGYIGVQRIEGSFFNVMGLPVQKLYDELIQFIKQ